MFTSLTLSRLTLTLESFQACIFFLPFYFQILKWYSLCLFNIFSEGWTYHWNIERFEVRISNGSVLDWSVIAIAISYGSDRSKTEPLYIWNKMVAILYWFWTKWLSILQNGTPFENRTLFENGTLLENWTEGYHWNSKHVRPHCCSQGGGVSIPGHASRLKAIYLSTSYLFLFSIFLSFVWNLLLHFELSSDADRCWFSERRRTLASTSTTTAMPMTTWMKKFIFR